MISDMGAETTEPGPSNVPRIQFGELSHGFFAPVEFQVKAIANQSRFPCSFVCVLAWLVSGAVCGASEKLPEHH
jgi:hypothetical protein